MELACTADPAEVGKLRAAAGQWLHRHGVGQQDCMDIVLVVSELATNAVQASNAGAPITLRMQIVDGSVTVTVRDHGSGFEINGIDHMADPDAPRGRGLPIVAAMTDALDATHRDGITEVRVVRRLNRDRTPPRGG